MTWIEYFYKKLEEYNIRNKEGNEQLIVEYLQNNLEVSIKNSKYGINDIMAFKENQMNFFENNPPFKINQKALELRKLSLSQIRLITDNLNPNIECLNCPFDVLKHIKLNHYPNLKKLSIDRVTSEELMNIIKNTNIEEIEIEESFPDEILSNSTFLNYKGKLVGIYNGRKIIAKNNTTYSTFGRARLCSNNLNKNMDVLLDLLNKSDKKDLKNISFFDKYEAYNDKISINPKFKYNIEYKETESSNKIGILTVNFLEDVKEVKTFIEKIGIYGFTINKVVLNLENKNYENLELLYSIAKKYETIVKIRNSFQDISAVDFISMRETLNYYKTLILQQNLSPLEKAAYGYDIIKSFVYKETANVNKSESREIATIIKTGNIVCVGFANFYAQLMKEVGVDGCAFGTEVSINGKAFGHERCSLTIDDNKYNVHGSFAFDPTWDCAKGVALVINSAGDKRLISMYSNDMKEDEQIIKIYDDISRYRYFMIGKEDYQKKFIGEKMPNYTHAKNYSNTSLEKNEIQEKFDLSNSNLSLEQFKKLLTRVKILEGYPIDAIEQTVDDALEVSGLKKIEIKEEYNHKL